ncbi:hypothetical protein EYF80_060291 [Liparis tanakae]|uniref:Uncharacterized protein n=1 Tax=Liparis tanakae TaxID=230148 RepID=A0A4Z2ELW0_9TELE|nr:hypothetical protein EYF80_060291 [Liparis tanakae]
MTERPMPLCFRVSWLTLGSWGGDTVRTRRRRVLLDQEAQGPGLTSCRILRSSPRILRAGSDLSGRGLIHSLMADITPLSMNVSFRSCLGERVRSKTPSASREESRWAPGFYFEGLTSAASFILLIMALTTSSASLMKVPPSRSSWLKPCRRTKDTLVFVTTSETLVKLGGGGTHRELLFLLVAGLAEDVGDHLPGGREVKGQEQNTAVVSRVFSSRERRRRTHSSSSPDSLSLPNSAFSSFFSPPAFVRSSSSSLPLSEPSSRSLAARLSSGPGAASLSERSPSDTARILLAAGRTVIPRGSGSVKGAAGGGGAYLVSPPFFLLPTSSSSSLSDCITAFHLPPPPPSASSFCFSSSSSSSESICAVLRFTGVSVSESLSASERRPGGAAALCSSVSESLSALCSSSFSSTSELLPRRLAGDDCPSSSSSFSSSSS